MQNGAASHSQTSLALPETDLNTIPDPRSPSPSQVSRQSSNTSMRHPDLSNEVATLSTKLINAINLQTNLDDQLQSSRHELEAARDRVAQLETALREHETMVERGLLVKRSDSERIQNGLRSKIDDEHKARSEAEREKRAMELELETLTSALFEEANSMVASARQEKEQADRRADQVQAKLDETQALLASHQEQLSELKAVMQQLHTSVVDSSPVPAPVTSPSSPVLASSDRPPRSSDYLELQPHHQQLQQQQQQQHQLRAGTPTQVSFPEAPLSYASLIQPIVRTDLAAYDDFLALLRTTQHTSSRATSGTFSGLNVLGLGTRDSVQSSVSVSAPQGPSNSSDPSSSPSLPGSFMGSAEPPSPTSTTNLRDTKFYKRVLTEDIEPTLRLDTAPGLSWLARRTVLNAMLTGNLVIEPLPSSTRLYGATFGCSMCGETRKDSDYVRRHRFKTSESEDAQTYPLCDYCLARVRSTCDFMGFMRLAKKGHYRNETYPECRYAWEESVRMRERMFWSRLGGGVVPANPGLTTVPQSPALTDAGFEEARASRGVPIEDAIRLGRTLGGLRKRQSGSRTSISSLNGIVSNSTSARQTSLPENTLPPSSSSGSRLNPARPSSSAAVVQRSHAASETVSSMQESVEDTAPPPEAVASAPSADTIKVEKTEELPSLADLAPSPAATPDPNVVDEAVEQPETLQPAAGPATISTEAAEAAEAAEVAPQVRPALPGPNGSLRQFPRNRSAVASPDSPSKPSSPASSYSTPQPIAAAMAPPPPKMSKVASMAARFQQQDASAADVSQTGPESANSRSPSRPRSKSRGPPAITSERQSSPYPPSQTQIHGAFG